ncbi:MAG: glycosyltransferase [Proteobacteria bacterium]|nr:glycosyltransferase [Pseudomonadota bacterium]
MARVTIGIPVYNGEAMIGECLDSILAQSFTDYHVVICDNASTDRTAEICNYYASKDSRISIISSEVNVGHEANFRKAFSFCQTEYFCWRADDDYATENFLDSMIAALDANPDCNLAAPTVVTRISETEYTPTTSAAIFSKNNTIKEIGSSLFNYHASIFYGVWRTQHLKDIVHTMWDRFPHAYSRDHLTVLRPIINRQIIGCPETLFTQRIYSPPKGDGMRGGMPISARIERLEKLMPLFYEAFDNEVSQSNLSNSEKKYIGNLRNSYTYQKLRASRIRIIRLKIKRIIIKLLGRPI